MLNIIFVLLVKWQVGQRSQRLQTFSRKVRKKFMWLWLLLLLLLLLLPLSSTTVIITDLLKECSFLRYFIYHILLNIMRIQVQCAPEFHNDFWQKNLFCFSRVISQELIMASLFIIEAIINPFLAIFHAWFTRNISAAFSK